jgi:hypothetical protein
MTDSSHGLAGHEPGLQTVEMVCDRLAELGLAVGPDTARQLIREVLAAEAPRVDARLRESLETALQTIRIAAQAAMGVLAQTASEARAREPAPPPEPLHVSRAAPARPMTQTPPAPQPPARPQPPPTQAPRRPPPPEPQRQAEAPRPAGPPRPRFDIEEDEPRPMFRRPGRR